MTPLELKNALRVLQAEVTALRDRVGALESSKPKVEVLIPSLEAMKKVAAEQPSNRGLCPKCQKKPNHFFHVRTCKG